MQLLDLVPTGETVQSAIEINKIKLTKNGIQIEYDAINGFTRLNKSYRKRCVARILSGVATSV